jgi:hypothetical protein
MENMNDKSTILEQAIIDAKLLRESAKKAAENELISKYAIEVKESISRFLEQDEEDPFAPPEGMPGLGGLPGEDAESMPIDPAAASIPLAATDGERLCACPEEDEEVDIDFGNIETDMAQEPEMDLSLPPQEEENPEQLREMENDMRVELPESFSGRLVPIAEMLGQDSAAGQVLEMVLDGTPVPKDLIEMCLREMQDLAFQGYDDSSLMEVANELREFYGSVDSQEEPQMNEQELDILSQIAGLDSELNEISVEDDEIDLGMLESLIADLENTPTGKLGGGLNDREVNDKNDIVTYRHPMEGFNGYENISPSVKSSEGSGNQLIVAMRQRDRHDKDEEREQQLEPRKDNCSNTISTIQKDNLVFDKSLGKPTEEVYEVNKENDIKRPSYIQYQNGNHSEAHRVYNEEGISQSIKTYSGRNGFIVL